MLTKRSVLGILSAIVFGLLLVTPTFAAQTIPGFPSSSLSSSRSADWWGGNQVSAPWRGQVSQMHMTRPTIVGQVASIKGSTLKVTSQGWQRKNSSAKTYQVDASRASITKNGVKSSLSKIKTGDLVVVNGTTRGNRMIARTIMAYRINNYPKDNGRYYGYPKYPDYSRYPYPSWPYSYGTELLSMNSNGEPIIVGKITAEMSNDGIIRVTSDDITYRVDVSDAQIERDGQTIDGDEIESGDQVIVQGTVRDNHIDAAIVLGSSRGWGNMGDWLGQFFGF